jgi:putative serine protease PepD
MPPHARPPKAARTGLLVAGLALVAALALGGTGVAIGREIADDRSPSAGSAQVAPTVVGSETDEPVAAVAAALSPAVVQIETGSGLGSGFVYDAEQGYAMTAAHVVEGSQQVTVRLADGRAVDGTVLGADAASDIAVVQVDADDLTAAALATGEPVEVGQLAVAIGSPFGLDQTVTSGIVSAVGRTVETPNGAGSMIQTDASINPGNSGGALADRQGRVIGVNVSIASQGGGNDGVGFAVPIDTAVSVAERLVAGEPITNGYLGIGVADPTDGTSGALVQQIEPGGPAEDAGLQQGDVVTSIDGDAVASASDLVAAVRSRQPGTEVTVTVDRQGQEVTLQATLGESGQ